MGSIWLTCSGCFYPRARVGRDERDPHWLRVLTVFLSTRPRGARPVPGADPAAQRDVSIHAPAWGATPW